MEALLTPILRPGRAAFDPKVTAHFHASAELYKLWSPEGHLHFGYWKWPMAPIARRPMLEELVFQVVDRLKLPANAHVADLGCGYGAAARLVAGQRDVRVDAFSVVREQVHEGCIAGLVDGTYDRVRMHLRDFRDTGLPDASLDGAYALESLCYGTGHGKADVLQEIARVLKPDARIALTDGFLVKQPRGWRKKLVDTVATGWAVQQFPKLNSFTKALERAGFTDIRVEDISWRMGVCALHGLPLLAWTLLRQWWSGEPMLPLERAHLRSCGLGIFLGTQRGLFRYCLISARKGRTGDVHVARALDA